MYKCYILNINTNVNVKSKYKTFYNNEEIKYQEVGFIIYYLSIYLFNLIFSL